jgi:preprotein translocase subunit YajC
MRKQKEMTNYRNSLKKGDKVITTGGIHGRITEVKDTFVTMDVGGDVKLKVDKNALLKDPSAD